MSFEMKAFGAFVRQLAKAGVGQALPLEAFVRQHEDTVRHVRREIHKGIAGGYLTIERADELQRLIDVLMAWHRTHGHVETHLDGSDWLSLGNGGHMRRKHLDENYECPILVNKGLTIEEKLTKENEDEE
jgi:hypothetical protein